MLRWWGNGQILGMKKRRDNTSWRLDHLVSLSAYNIYTPILSHNVNKPTRYQFNSISGAYVCGCHPFWRGWSWSHILYHVFQGTTHSIRKRTYKRFVAQDLLADMMQVDWNDVYSCKDLHLATDIFARKFRDTFNKHAPWILYQQSKERTDISCHLLDPETDIFYNLPGPETDP